MIYHKFKFGLRRNINVLICRLFGHRINNNPSHGWCQRCSLCWEEAYRPLDYFYMTGQTTETMYSKKVYECDHPNDALLIYDGEGRGRDECTMCGLCDYDIITKR